MMTTKKFLKELKQTIFDLKTDLRMLEGYSRFVDANTADYHDLLCGNIRVHIGDAENFIEHLEKRMKEKGNETLSPTVSAYARACGTVANGALMLAGSIT